MHEGEKNLCDWVISKVDSNNSFLLGLSKWTKYFPQNLHINTSISQSSTHKTWHMLTQREIYAALNEMYNITRSETV